MRVESHELLMTEVVIENTLVGEWVGLQVLMQLGTNSNFKCRSIILHCMVARTFHGSFIRAFLLTF